MRINCLGQTGLFVSELCLGTMTFGGRRGHLAADRRAAAARRRRPRPDRARCGHQFHRHGQRLFERSLRGDHRAGPQVARREARRGRRRHQGLWPHGQGPERLGRVARPYPRSGQGQPEAPAARPYRPLPDPRLRRLDPDRGDAGGARHPGAARPRPLRRRVELGRLADRQGARHRRAARARANPLAASLLHARRPRPRAGDRPDADLREGRADGLEPIGGRSPLGQIRPLQQPGRRGPAGEFSTSRPSTARAPTRSSRPCVRSPKPATAPWPRWRSPGCCTSRW